MPSRNYILKISLKHSEPLIWRRIEVPAKIKLSRLHTVVQSVMGWTNSHLHMFHSHLYGTFSSNYDDMLDAGGEPDDQDETKFRLDQLLHRARMKMSYIYDFGDHWEHDIVLEKIVPGFDDALLPYCYDGENACPPEDCGGIPGYEHIKSILTDPENEEYNDTLDWLGDEDFDPAFFSVHFTNMRLEQLRRKGRRKT